MNENEPIIPFPAPGHRAENETGSLEDLISYVNSYNSGEFDNDDRQMDLLMKILKLKLKLQNENVDISKVPSILNKS